MGIKDVVTILAFKYELSGTTNVDYIVYALVLHEQTVELIQSSGKLYSELKLRKLFNI